MSKVVIVTGGTRGIGLAIAKAYVKQGDQVITNYRNDETNAQSALEALQTNDSQAIIVQADISDLTQRNYLIHEATRHFGQIDILVNNAGTPGKKQFRILNNLVELTQYIALTRAE